MWRHIANQHEGDYFLVCVVEFFFENALDPFEFFMAVGLMFIIVLWPITFICAVIGRRQQKVRAVIRELTK